MAHTFELVTTNGVWLGRVELGRPDWPPGSIIYRGGSGPNLRVVELHVDVEKGHDDAELFRSWLSQRRDGSSAAGRH